MLCLDNYEKQQAKKNNKVQNKFFFCGSAGFTVNAASGLKCLDSKFYETRPFYTCTIQTAKKVTCEHGMINFAVSEPTVQIMLFFLKNKQTK